MDLCLICCSKDISKEENTTRLSRNLNIFFLLKNLLQVNNSQLETNLRECGNPEDWIRLCDQCTLLTKQAEKLHCKIVKTEIELRDVRKLIIDKTRLPSTIMLINNGVNDNHLLVKSEKWTEYEKREAIWETTRLFAKNFKYSDCTNTVSPFTGKDELATKLVNQKISYSNEAVLTNENVNDVFDTDLDLNDDVSDVELERSDKPEIKYDNDHDDNDKQLEETQSRNKRSKKFSPIKRPTIDGKYKCNFCDKLFEKRGTCTAHEAQKHVFNQCQFICDICGKAWSNNKSLISHRWAVHRVKADGTILPALPKIKYVSKSRPRTTNRVNKSMINIGGKWKCRHCDRLFNSKVGCYSHEATKHITSPGHFVCDICGKTWNSNNDLVKHKWGIHKVRVDGTPVPSKPKIVKKPQKC